LSKLDTLRLATSYILHLTQILDTDELPVQSITAPPTTISLSIQAPNSFVSEYQGFYLKSKTFFFLCLNRVGHIHLVIELHRYVL